MHPELSYSRKTSEQIWILMTPTVDTKNPNRKTYHVSHFSWQERTVCTRISRDCSRRRVSNISIFCQKPSFCQQSLQSSPLPSTNWEVGNFLSPFIINWKLTIHTSVAPKKSLEVQENDWILTELIVAACDQTTDFRAEPRHVHSSFCVDTLLPAGDLESSAVRHRLFVTFHSCNADV